MWPSGVWGGALLLKTVTQKFILQTYCLFSFFKVWSWTFSSKPNYRKNTLELILTRPNINVMLAISGLPCSHSRQHFISLYSLRFGWVTWTDKNTFVRYVRLSNEYYLYTQMHLLLAVLAFLVHSQGRFSGRQDSVLTCLADLLSSGNKLRAQDHAATELACLRWATATGPQGNRATPRTMIAIFDDGLIQHPRNVSIFLVGLVMSGTMLFAKSLPVRFVKSTLKLKPNIHWGCSTCKQSSAVNCQLM